MKQTEMKRRTPLHPGSEAWARKSTFRSQGETLKRKRRKNLSGKERRQASAFRRAVARDFCAVCGAHASLGTLIAVIDAHHVVSAQWLRRNAPDKVYDRRNALAVCRLDHEAHENASRRIPLTALTEQNWEFAREVLGEAAGDYLARRYAPSVPEEEERNEND